MPHLRSLWDEGGWGEIDLFFDFSVPHLRLLWDGESKEEEKRRRGEKRERRRRRGGRRSSVYFRPLNREATPGRYWNNQVTSKSVIHCFRYTSLIQTNWGWGWRGRGGAKLDVK